jgi:hypothetical protein
MPAAFRQHGAVRDLSDRSRPRPTQSPPPTHVWVQTRPQRPRGRARSRVHAEPAARPLRTRRRRPRATGASRTRSASSPERSESTRTASPGPARHGPTQRNRAPTGDQSAAAHTRRLKCEGRGLIFLDSAHRVGLPPVGSGRGQPPLSACCAAAQSLGGADPSYGRAKLPPPTTLHRVNGRG